MLSGSRWRLALGSLVAGGTGRKPLPSIPYAVTLIRQRGKSLPGLVTSPKATHLSVAVLGIKSPQVSFGESSVTSGSVPLACHRVRDGALEPGRLGSGLGAAVLVNFRVEWIKGHLETWVNSALCVSGGCLQSSGAHKPAGTEQGAPTLAWGAPCHWLGARTGRSGVGLSAAVELPLASELRLSSLWTAGPPPAPHPPASQAPLGLQCLSLAKRLTWANSLISPSLSLHATRACLSGEL